MYWKILVGFASEHVLENLVWFHIRSCTGKSWLVLQCWQNIQLLAALHQLERQHVPD
jgi:hypothetical protein